MNLFIDWISKNANLIIFDNDRNILSRIEFELLWNESSLLLPKLDSFLFDNNYNYFDIENIVVVNWPWSFTWVRTIVLLVNTINYIIKKNITSIGYFELFWNYPIIKTSSKRDCFIQKNKLDKIEIMDNDEIIEFLEKNNITNIYWDFFWKQDIKIFDKIDYLTIIKKIKLKKEKLIQALYIKKPNIS